MESELAYIRAQSMVGPDGTVHGSNGQPVHWMKKWGLSKHVQEAHLAADHVRDGRHEIYRRLMEDELGVAHLECVCGAMVPGTEETLGRAGFVNAPGHVRDETPSTDPLSQQDPWLDENWEPAAECFTRGELLGVLKEERRTLDRLIRNVTAVAGEEPLDDRTAEWMAGARRHRTRLGDRIHAVQFGDHRPYVHEQDADGVWWVVCTCGAWIEGRVGETINEIGFRSEFGHLDLGLPLDADMRPPTPE